MSFISNIMKSMRVDQDDDYDLDDDYNYGDDYDEDPQHGGNIFTRSKSQDMDDDGVEDRPLKPTLFSRKAQAQPQQAHRAMEVTMIKPTSMDDSREICDYLLQGKAVVLNMEGLHMEIAQRIIDFTSGAAYSLDGNLQKISNYIFIATPPNVELSGDFQNILAASSDVNIGGLNLRV